MTAYKLVVAINNKPIEFKMLVDETLKPKVKISDKVANKWQARLLSVAHAIFEENNAE
jgi:hypothetical protein